MNSMRTDPIRSSFWATGFLYIFLTLSDLLPWKTYVFSIVPKQLMLVIPFSLRLHRIIRQGSSARDFVPVQSFKNGGILYVFPVFETAEMVQKIR